MFDIDRWQEIFETIRKNKLRTFLTGLSVASGIFILVVLLGFGRGMENGIRKEFEKDASNRIIVWTQTTTKEYKGLNPGRRIQMKNDNYDYIYDSYIDELEYKSAIFRVPWGTSTNYKNESVSYAISGVYPNYQQIENQLMVDGRYIDQMDLDHRNKVVVISNKIKRELLKDVENPLEEYLQISGINFKVVGIYTDVGGEREENNLFVPFTTAQSVFNGADRLNNLTYTLKPEKSFDEAVKASSIFTAEIKQIFPGSTYSFS